MLYWVETIIHGLDLKVENIMGFLQKEYYVRSKRFGMDI